MILTLQNFSFVCVACVVYARAMKILVSSHEDRLFVLQHSGLQMLTEVGVTSSHKMLNHSYCKPLIK